MLNRFDGQTDFLQCLSEYLADEDLSLHSNQRAFRIAERVVQDRVISGLAKSGPYGFESEITNTADGTVSYNRQSDDADLVPLYYHLFLPMDCDEGIVLLQNYNQTGMKSAFENFIGTRFRDGFADYRLHLNKIIPYQLIDDLINNGRLVTLRFVRYSVPPDSIDAYGGRQHEEQEGIVELSVSARRGRSFDIRERIRDVMEHRRRQNQVLELEQFRYDSTKIEINMAGRIRTIDLDDFARLKPRFDVANQIEFDETGHPTAASIADVAANLSNELAERIGIG